MTDKMKFDSLILVSQNWQIDAAKKAYSLLAKSGKSPLILTGLGIKFADESYQLRSLEDYQAVFCINYSLNLEAAHNLVEQLADQRISKGTSIRQLLTYKNVSLLELSRRFLFSRFIPLFYHLELCWKILELEKPSEVYAFGKENTLEKVFLSLCTQAKLKFTYLGKSRRLFTGFKSFAHNFVRQMKMFRRTFLVMRFYFWNAFVSSDGKLKNPIMFFVPPERFFISMLPVILKYASSQRLVVNTLFSGSEKRMKEKKINYQEFFGYRPIFASLSTKRFVDSIRGKLFGNEYFLTFFYRNIQIGPLVAPIVKEMVEDELPEKIADVKAVRKLAILYQPKLAVVADCYFDLALIIKSLKVKTVALQSGHAEEFIFFYPHPADFITVDGGFWRDFLVKKGILEEKIVVCGPPKFDFLNHKQGSVKAPFFINQRKTASKIIIFAPAYACLAQATLAEQKKQQLKQVCIAARQIKAAHLIIKLHPYDRDIKEARNIVENSGLDNCTLIKNADMHRLLADCDLLVTQISTVAYEGVLMDKNVALLAGRDNFRSDDLWDFRRFGCALEIAQMNNLADDIQKALFHPETNAKLREGRRKYLFEHAFALDGNAALRIKETIDKANLLCPND